MTVQPKFLPMTMEEAERLGIDRFDVILITGDAYVDHPSFGTALLGRVLWDAGYSVGVITQPDWRSDADFKRLGEPRLFFSVSAGNVDSLVNAFTPNLKRRRTDAYSPGGRLLRPDRATLVYTDRVHALFPATPVVIGGIEASLRRFAHYDYWSDTVRRSILLDAKADLLLYGNAERALVELAHRLARGEPIQQIRELRGTAFVVPPGWKPGAEWAEIDSREIDRPGRIEPHPD
ncbi:MAG: YgiQ family radical SAM protein, partial [Methanomicrobiales archaeon HGW-Methanomicrobiales-2]